MLQCRPGPQGPRELQLLRRTAPWKTQWGQMDGPWTSPRWLRPRGVDRAGRLASACPDLKTILTTPFVGVSGGSALSGAAGARLR